jgi:hypothetical protein
MAEEGEKINAFSPLDRREELGASFCGDTLKKKRLSIG